LQKSAQAKMANIGKQRAMPIRRVTGRNKHSRRNNYNKQLLITAKIRRATTTRTTTTTRNSNTERMSVHWKLEATKRGQRKRKSDSDSNSNNKNKERQSYWRRRFSCFAAVDVVIAFAQQQKKKGTAMTLQ